jgi:hypothetical protein
MFLQYSIRMSDCNGKPTAVMACAWREDLQWKARPVSQAMCEGRGMPNQFHIQNSKQYNTDIVNPACRIFVKLYSMPRIFIFTRLLTPQNIHYEENRIFVLRALG